MKIIVFAPAMGMGLPLHFLRPVLAGSEDTGGDLADMEVEDI